MVVKLSLFTCLVGLSGIYSNPLKPIVEPKSHFQAVKTMIPIENA